MKKINFLVAFLAIAAVACAQKSPRKQAEGNINGTKIEVDYGAPSVRGRKVWGGLEAYGKVWRAGANENTTVSFDKAVKVGGETLAAGKYGFFIIPNEKGNWVAIFNKKNSDWGAYSYDAGQDAARYEVKPEWADDNQEMLMYSVGKSSIDFAWEKVRLSIPVE